ncbi:unnamed protein product [Trichogramma brassicae]|uniref:RING-type domain-containing protein n=1 Tax=Trichogramma brassicae TaxID=86971 RepID=A0A6H5IT65_9HYME|nr:unnamed protein product [Trichogramma brassicae]
MFPRGLHVWQRDCSESILEPRRGRQSRLIQVFSVAYGNAVPSSRCGANFIKTQSQSKSSRTWRSRHLFTHLRGCVFANAPILPDFCDYRRPVDKIVQMLVDHGAIMETRNRDGNSPLDLAVSRLDVQLVKSLLKHGASLHNLNEDKMFSAEFTSTKLKNYPFTLNIIEMVQLLQSVGFMMSFETRLKMLKCWIKVRGNDTDHLIPEYTERYRQVASAQRVALAIETVESVLREGNRNTYRSNEPALYSNTARPLNLLSALYVHESGAARHGTQPACNAEKRRITYTSLNLFEGELSGREEVLYSLRFSLSVHSLHATTSLSFDSMHFNFDLSTGHMRPECKVCWTTDHVQKVQPCGHRVCTTCVRRFEQRLCAECRRPIVSYLPEHLLYGGEAWLDYDEDAVNVERAVLTDENVHFFFNKELSMSRTEKYLLLSRSPGHENHASAHDLTSDAAVISRPNFGHIA